MKPHKSIFLLTFLLSSTFLSADTIATNTWERSSKSNALVSNPQNWSLKHAPKPNEVVRFTPYHSRSAIWDSKATHEVAGWIQESGFMGIITLETSRDEEFKIFTVNGDMEINDGAITHHPNDDKDNWWLNLHVTGDLTVNQGAYISASGKGFGSGKGPSPGVQPGYGASHGGQGAPNSQNYNSSAVALTYDSIINPSISGSGGTTKEGSDNSYNGGGVIFLKVDKDLTVDGYITANADNRDIDETNYGGAAGGTINITIGNAFKGSGRITANGGRGWHEGAGGGGGGRIAIRQNTPWPAFSMNNVHAYGGCGESQSPDRVDADRHVRGAPGTIYYENQKHSKNGGEIIVREISYISAAWTRIPSDMHDDVYECKDAILNISNNAFVLVTSSLNLRMLQFSGPNNGIDLNNNMIFTSSVKYGNSVLDELGMYRENTEDALNSVIFNGGSITIQTYLKPL